MVTLNELCFGAQKRLQDIVAKLLHRDCGGPVRRFSGNSGVN